MTKQLGVLLLGWVIRKSILGKFNTKLNYQGKWDQTKLIRLKEDMTFAENNHLLGFLLMQAYVFLLAFLNVELWQIAFYTVFNIIFNFYLVLLQQYNKRRIDRVLDQISAS